MSDGLHRQLRLQRCRLRTSRNPQGQRQARTGPDEAGEKATKPWEKPSLPCLCGFRGFCGSVLRTSGRKKAPEVRTTTLCATHYGSPVPSWGRAGAFRGGVTGAYQAAQRCLPRTPSVPPSPPKNLLWAAAATYAVCSAVLRRNYVGPSAHLPACLPAAATL